MCAIGEGWGVVRVPVDGNAAQFTWLAQVAGPNQHGCHESADTAQHLPQSGHGFHRQQVHQHDDGSLSQEVCKYDWRSVAKQRPRSLNRMFVITPVRRPGRD